MTYRRRARPPNVKFKHFGCSNNAGSIPAALIFAPRRSQRYQLLRLEVMQGSLSPLRVTLGPAPLCILSQIPPPGVWNPPPPPPDTTADVSLFLLVFFPGLLPWSKMNVRCQEASSVSTECAAEVVFPHITCDSGSGDST